MRGCANASGRSGGRDQALSRTLRPAGMKRAPATLHRPLVPQRESRRGLYAAASGSERVYVQMTTDLCRAGLKLDP